MPDFRVTFTVRGTRQFPYDMLRYDHCYPSCPGSVDALTIQHHDADEYLTPRTVNLAMHVNTTKTHLELLIKHTNIPTFDRWTSFGWEVTEVQFRKVESL